MDSDSRIFPGYFALKRIWKNIKEMKIGSFYGDTSSSSVPSNLPSCLFIPNLTLKTLASGIVNVHFCFENLNIELSLKGL